MSQEESHVENELNLTASRRNRIVDRLRINYLLIFIRKSFSQIAL